MNQHIIIAIAFIFFLVIWSASAQPNQPFTVVRHHDGDTTTVRDRQGNEFNIRYLVVDANELGQAGGKEAKEYLYQLLPVGSKVAISFTGNKSYGRAEGTIYRDGKNISLAMLQAGHAVIDDRYTRRLSPELLKQYRQAQDNAKKQRIGRWGSKRSQQMPSEWRKSK